MKWLSGVLYSAEIALFSREYVDLYEYPSSVHRAHTIGSQYSPGNMSIRTTLHQACRTCARSDRINSLGILRSAQRCTKRASRAHARIALIPREYFDLHDLAPRAHPVHPLGSRYFPRKYLSLHHFVSGTRQARTLGSHSFPGNTAMCTILHQAHIKCAEEELESPPCMLWD